MLSLSKHESYVKLKKLITRIVLKNILKNDIKYIYVNKVIESIYYDIQQCQES